MATSPSPTKKIKVDNKLRWNNGGPEDHLILDALNRKIITTETMPAKIQSTFPNELGEFNIQVLRNHVQRLKLQWANQNHKSFTGRE